MPTYIGTIGHDFPGDGYDRLYGSDGSDTLYSTLPGIVVIEGGADNDQLYVKDGSNGIGHLYGGDDGDKIYGAENGDRLYGGEGDDYIVGGNQNAPTGDDYIEGGAGADSLHGRDGVDVIYGGDGDDQGLISLLPQPPGTIIFRTQAGLFGGDGNDILDGGRGNDYLEGGSGSDRVFGGDGNDTMFGNDDPDYLVGGDGDDLISGDAGADALEGGFGNDAMRGGAGADWMDGGYGFDVALYDTAAAGVVVRLDTGNGVSGDAAGDLLFNIEGLTGSVFDDTLVGSAGNNQLIGNAGNDTLYGLGGDDLLLGGAGNDTFYGGSSADVLIGGDGVDYFRFSAGDNVSGQFDVVTDFADGSDQIYLHGWDASTLTIVQSGSNTVITTIDSGYTTGVILQNTFVSQVLDQVFIL